MINKDFFIGFIQIMEDYDKEVDNWMNLKIDFYETEISKYYSYLYNLFIKSHFDQNGKEWIDWYLYERVDIRTGEVLPWYDEEGIKHICNNAEDLWEIVKNHKLIE